MDVKKFHAVKVTFSHKGLHPYVTLTSQLWPHNSRRLDYDPKYNQSVDQAEKWMNEHGHKVVGCHEAPNCDIILLTTNFDKI